MSHHPERSLDTPQKQVPNSSAPCSFMSKFLAISFSILLIKQLKNDKCKLKLVQIEK